MWNKCIFGFFNEDIYLEIELGHFIHDSFEPIKGTLLSRNPIEIRVSCAKRLPLLARVSRRCRLVWRWIMCACTHRVAIVWISRSAKIRVRILSEWHNDINITETYRFLIGKNYNVTNSANDWFLQGIPLPAWCCWAYLSICWWKELLQYPSPPVVECHIFCNPVQELHKAHPQAVLVACSSKPEVNT